MPVGGVVGTVSQDGQVQLNEVFFKYIGGIEDATGRVSDYVDPTTATLTTLINALIAAKLMKAS